MEWVHILHSPHLRVERADARGDHVGAPDGLYLLQAPELVVVQDLVKIN